MKTAIKKYIEMHIPDLKDLSGFYGGSKKHKCCLYCDASVGRAFERKPVGIKSNPLGL